MEVLHTALEILGSSLQITGLVTVMMMMIEAVNIESRGKFFSGLRRSAFGQVVFGAAIGIIPGCLGGFASVSLYTHGMLSLGALVATLIASSGDEAFVMLAMFPQKSLMIMGLLFIIATITGLCTDVVRKALKKKNLAADKACEEGFALHEKDTHHHHEEEASHSHGRHFGWKRLVLAVGISAFIVSLATGAIGHEHSGTGEEEVCCCHGHHEAEEAGGIHINLLDETWMNIVFAILSIGILGAVVFAGDHFVEEHLWKHVVCRHLPSIFAWTLGVLTLITVLTSFFDISTWVNDNTALMILLATAIGIIPESGPHLIFVTLYAAGIVPLPVLLASCISQDGHASIPLLAENRMAFFKAKAINCAVALVCGFLAYLMV